MRMHVYRVWKDRLRDDEAFEDDMTQWYSARSKKATSTVGEDQDIINEDNLEDFMEAIDIENIVSVEEMEAIINQNSPKEQAMRYAIMKEKLFELIIEKKAIPFRDVVH